MNDKIKYFLVKLISITFAIIIIISVFYNLFLAERLENIDKMLSLTKEENRTYVKDKGGVSERQALTWAREIADIVEYLHTRETAVVHRDLTPENLVLDMRGSLILVDFGAANEFVGTVTGTLVGKPSYISPEQFSGRANLQSDLYSLGAVLFYLLTATDPEPLSVNSPRSLKPEISESFDRLVQDSYLRAAELVHGKLPELERQLQEAGARQPSDGSGVKGRGVSLSILSTARSLSGSVPITSASTSRPSRSATWISSAPLMTW